VVQTKVCLVCTYPKVDLEVAAAAELAIADLVGHGHLVVAVEVLVETLARVGFHLNVVCGGEADEAEPES